MTLPSSIKLEGHPVGGLSALSFNPATNRLRLLSDDPGRHAPSRWIEAELDLRDADLNPADLKLLGTVSLVRANGSPFTLGAIDPEGLARSPDGRLFISSEAGDGSPDRPFLWEVDPETGRQRRHLSIPGPFLPNPDGTQGVQPNRAFESLTIDPEGRFLFTATENRLVQDIPGPDGVEHVRLLRYDLRDDRFDAEFLYPLDADPTSGRRIAGGLVELLALDANRLLALERHLALPGGYQVRLYAVDLHPASPPPGDNRPIVRKQRLLDLGASIQPLWNVEGLAFGPRLPDGRRTLLFLSDNNFRAFEATQLAVFAIGTAPAP